MEKVLSFWFQHLPVIIEVVTILILIFVTYVVVVVLKNRTKGGVDLSDMESTLRKILTATEKTSAIVQTGGGVAQKAGTGPMNSSAKSANAAAGSGGASGAVDSAVVVQLEGQIGVQDEKIKQLEGQLKKYEEEKSKDTGPSKEELTSKISELQAKLADYEIIEDDIADLNLYKEQSEKLKGEVEDLKKQLAAGPSGPGVTTATAQPPPPAAAASSAPAAPVSSGGGVDDDLMAEFSAAVAQQKSGTLVEEKTPEPAAPASGVEDDLMAEFAAAVAAQKSGKLVEEPAPPSEPKPQPEVKSEIEVDTVETKVKTAEVPAEVSTLDPVAPPAEIMNSEVVAPSVTGSQAVADTVAAQPNPEEPLSLQSQRAQTPVAPPPETFDSGDDIFAEFCSPEEDVSSAPISNSSEEAATTDNSVEEVSDIKSSASASEHWSGSDVGELVNKGRSESPENQVGVTDEIIAEFKERVEARKIPSRIAGKMRDKLVSAPLKKAEGDGLQIELDTTKMMEEASALSEVSSGGKVDSLTENLNTEKMLSEVDELNAFVNSSRAKSS